MKKKFDFGKGLYYFNIKSGGNHSITIKRINPKEAKLAFLNYLNIGKDCEWLGKWNGKKFEETGMPTMESIYSS